MKNAGLLFTLLILLFSSCKEKKTSNTASSKVFQDLVESYTQGTISVAGEITVRFNQEVPKANQGETISDIISIKPAVAGTAYWFDAQTIAFKPDNWLKPDTKYRVTINIGKLFYDLAPSKETVSFSIGTKKQDYSVRVASLQAQGMAYKMEGSVLLSDVANDSKVEQMITLSDDALSNRLKWLHVSGIKHVFYVDSIQRSEDTKYFDVVANGDPVSLSKAYEINVEIPGLNNFILLDTRVQQEPSQCLLIEFSDPLNADQDISGLVELAGVKAKVIKDNNTLKVYPDKRVNGSISLSISEDLKNIMGYRLKEGVNKQISFEAIKPNVRFAQSGVIIPSGNQECIVPFQAVNLSAVDLYVIKIFEKNIPYFLQNNRLDGDNSLSHYGRLILKKKIDLSDKNVLDAGSWKNYSLNLKSIIEVDPGAIYRIEFRFKKSYSLYPCSETSSADEAQEEFEDLDMATWDKGTYWPRHEYHDGYSWRERNNPCHISYYQNKWVYRNVVASNLGLIVKTNGQGAYRVFVTDLMDARSLSGITVSFFNHQNQLMAETQTRSEGMADIELDGLPWLVVAKRGAEKTFLRVDDGTALSYSSFDVGGVQAQKGLKAFFYGERGVWRPGDTIHLSFVVNDVDNPMPESQPATLYFYNTENKLVRKIVNAHPVGKFYKFTLKTDAEAPTGNWLAKVSIGGATFTKTIKIETIKPNRLKVKLTFDKEILDGTEAIKGELNVAWLHGAVGKNLKVKADVNFRPQNMRFDKLPGYVFSDPAIKLDMRETTAFDGKTDDKGHVSFSMDKKLSNYSASWLKAIFTVKAFEPGGEFSIVQITKDYSPFERYVGLRLPEKPRHSWHYNTDKDYDVEVATVDVEGKAVDVEKLDVEVYKLEWSWWWHSNNQNLAYYIRRNQHRPIIKKALYTKNGKGAFRLNIPKHSWGRYLIRVIDSKGHSTGQIAYFDWPYRKSNDGAGGATRLSLNTDKGSYSRGEKIQVQFPAEKGARALVSVESGTRILNNFWVEIGEDGGKFELEATPEMAPNAYISIALIQPYEKTINENPIRMYGIVPVFVSNPANRLLPLINMPESVEPEQDFKVRIKEKNGKAMTYTLAIVDEGLLDISNFKTPDIHSAFFKRQALLVKMWDMFDYVSGAFGGKIEKVFGIGGGDENMDQDKKDDNRFKPVVLYSGPHQIKAGEEAVLSFTMPKYIGSVKAMVVAGDDNSYGSSEKLMPVKKPVMVLATLPRVISPGEKVSLPVSAFIMDETIKNAKVSVTVDDMFTISDNTRTIEVNETGEHNVNFSLKVAAKTGTGNVKVLVETSKGKADYTINIKVRNPNPPVRHVEHMVLEKGQSHEFVMDLPGMEGSNTLTMEFSSMPPLNLDRRLRYLIRYPYGCVEQTTSSVFPQLFVKKLIKPDAMLEEQMTTNIEAGLNRLMSFQKSGGAFSYWPGNSYVSSWGTVYATHFIVEAEKQGYQLPYGMKEKALEYLGTRAAEWSRSSDRYYYDYTQAYRLYVLALAGEADLSAMNRLRQKSKLSNVSKWRLAAAYALVGKKDISESLIEMDKLEVAEYEDLSETYGSRWRDYGMLLETLVLLNNKSEAARLIKEFSEVLSDDSRWLSTQTTAWMLMSVAKAKDVIASDDKPMQIQYKIATQSTETLKTEEPIRIIRWNSDVDSMIHVENKGSNIAFVTVRSEGIPLFDKSEAKSKNIDLKILYTNLGGVPIDPTSIAMGTDFKMVFSVKYTGAYRNRDIKNVALKQIFPAGWEIINSRLYGEGYRQSGDKPDYMDIRDDRIYMFFDLDKSQEMTFEVLLNAAYEGEYVLPATLFEAMYSDNYYARTRGKKVKVVR